MKILFINGVNLNMTGKREQSIYGTHTLEEINRNIKSRLYTDVCEFYQTNIEGEICTALQTAEEKGFEGIVLNAGAYSHYSIAIRDAISAINLPVVEVHISNIYGRESFRNTSVLSPVCCGVIAGFGEYGYVLAALALKKSEII